MALWWGGTTFLLQSTGKGAELQQPSQMCSPRAWNRGKLRAKLGKKASIKKAEIKKEKPFSREEPELVAGKAPEEGRAGSKPGCREPAVGKGFGIHNVHFVAHSGLWDEAKNPNSSAL